MRSMFLSFPFRPENASLRDQLVRLVESFDVRVLTGESLGGATLQNTIFARIDQCDALMALLTKTDKLARGGYGSTDWVKGEFAHAKAKGKPSIALIEQGVKYSGPFSDDEHIPFRRTDPAAYLLRVAETVATWKRVAGRTLKLQILPPDVAKVLGFGDGIQCTYRLYAPSTDERTNWRTATVVAEKGGTFAYLKGVYDEHLIEIEVQHGALKWRSPATSGWGQVEVQSLGGPK